MGKRNGQAELPPLAIGPTSTRLVAPDSAFWSVHNFTPTDEGGYISVKGPLPLIPADGGGPPPSGTADTNPLTYGTTYGIFHARLMGGERDILLLHTDNMIWEFIGWSRRWRAVVGPAAELPLYTDTLPTPSPSDFRSQFVATPNGIVIIPSFGRSYFYDGVKCLPLGYDKVPGPPSGLGPSSTGTSLLPDVNEPLSGVNDSGYAVDGLWGTPIVTTVSIVGTGLDPYFRLGRIGTITTPGNMPAIDETDTSNIIGYLEPGRWRARLQWVDCWGNLSPLSPESNDVVFTRQPSEKLVQTGSGPDVYTLSWCNADMVRKQIAWEGLSPGPDGTIGRVLYRTKDMLNSGDTRFFEVPRDAASNAQAFATLPDNVSRFWPDNIPDAWLVNPAIDVVQVPMFRLAVMAFGCLFAGNLRSDPGALVWSMPGRWGTFERRARMYPDPTGAAITGMVKVDGGLLVFTETSMYLVTPNAEGDGFRSATVSNTIGCVSPTSIATMRNGVTVWLGRDGFYAYGGGEPSFLFEQHRYHAKRFNRAGIHRSVAVFDPVSGQYRCWVPYEESGQANMCFCYDGSAWHTRDETSATGATVTADHRRLLIISGTFDGDAGVWVVDHGGAVQPCELKTAWLRSLRSKDRSSIRFIWLWLRETGTYTTTGRIRVDVYRDYRSEICSTSWTEAYPVEGSTGPDQPAEGSFWGTATWGTSSTWRMRRPYWVRVDVDVPTCEVFRFKVSCDNEMEILAVSFDEQPRDSAGATAYGV